jgi:uncharacterized membrane protein YqjE
MTTTFALYTLDHITGDWQMFDDREATDMRALANDLLDDWLTCDIDLYGIVQFLRTAGSQRVWPVEDDDIDDGTDDDLLRAMAEEARSFLARGDFFVDLFFMMLSERLRVEVVEDDSDYENEQAAAMLDAIDDSQ